MERYAQLIGNTVVNVIESEVDPDGVNGHWVACGNASPGWSYDGTSFHPPESTPEPRHISVGAFYDRFGDQKWPIFSSTDPAVQGLIKDTQVRKWIDLDSPQLPAGLDMLIAKGFAIDKDAILNAPIQPNERP